VLPRWWLEPIDIHVALPPGRYRPARVSAFIDALKLRMHALPGFRPAQ
jgi:DNA-binding transcriptional LysR family regulator